MTRCLLLFALLLVACAPSAAPSTPTVQPTPPVSATRAPTDTSTLAAQAAQGALSRQLKLAIDAVHVTDAQPIQWPDSCLGVPVSGMMCAMHVVSGYRVALTANDHRYEVHTNDDGSQLAVVPGPLPPVGGLTFTRQTEQGCETAIVRDTGVMYGTCDGTFKTVPFADTTQARELSQYSVAFQAFATDTPAGYLNFAGQGDRAASSAEQRSLAEWARLIVDEAVGGRTSAAAGQALAWHREGGIAGFCDDLTINAAGQASATSCQGGQAKHLGQCWLSSSALAQWYTWHDGLGRVEENPPTVTTPDAMTIRWLFDGRGSTAATDQDRQAIEAFAAQQYAQFSNPAKAAATAGGLMRCQ
jgi:hypothetical protein